MPKVLVVELRGIFASLVFTPGEMRCMLIPGAGDKAFSFGGDIKKE
jgi:hypothetical protein